MNPTSECKCGHGVAAHYRGDGCCNAQVELPCQTAWGACQCKEYQPAVERGCGAAMQERLDNLGTALGRMLAEDIAEIERG